MPVIDELKTAVLAAIETIDDDACDNVDVRDTLTEIISEYHDEEDDEAAAA